MASFVNNVITRAGTKALASAVAGMELEFTKIMMGSGSLPPDVNIKTLEGLIEPQVKVDITKLKTNGDDTAIIGGTFLNNEAMEGFWYRECGLFAKDPENPENEIMFSYGNAGEYAEYIPPSGSQTAVEKNIDVHTYIGDASNVTIYINSDAYATVQQYLEFVAIARAAHARADEAYEMALRALAESQRLANELANQVKELESKVSMLMDSVFNELTTNPWILTFADLNGCVLTSGIWNKTRQRLEC